MRTKLVAAPNAVTKTLTGIDGFDDITGGGLPRGRTTLVMGGPGCGKTVFALQTLVNGARRAKEGGVLLVTDREVLRKMRHADDEVRVATRTGSVWPVP